MHKKVEMLTVRDFLADQDLSHDDLNYEGDD